MDFAITDNTRFDANKRLDSDQRVSIPCDRLTSEVTLNTTLVYRLAALYFATLERSVGALIKVNVDRQGIELIVRGRRAALRFGTGIPEITPSRAAIGWPITGGWALDGSADGRGTFHIGAEWDDVRENLSLFTRVENYTPSLTGPKASPLRGLAYSLTQRKLHKLFTHRFLAEATRELMRET